MRSAKHWCFTLNNPNEDERRHLLGLYSTPEHGIVYLVFGEEVGDSGTPHYQGFISFNARKTAAFCKRCVSQRAHIEIARGTPAQAAEYCKKDGSFSEYGSIPGGAGARTDLLAVKSAIDAGATIRDVADAHFATYVRYERSVRSYINLKSEPRDFATNTIVRWGATGTGKTRGVYDFHAHSEIYTHPGAGWFDGYTGQPVVLFDDFNGSEFKLSYLLKLLDRYPMQVPVKGGYVNWRPQTVYITSNKDPQDWYEGAHDEQRRALFRRITRENIHHIE